MLDVKIKIIFSVTCTDDQIQQVILKFLALVCYTMGGAGSDLLGDASALPWDFDVINCYCV